MLLIIKYGIFISLLMLPFSGYTMNKLPIPRYEKKKTEDNILNKPQLKGILKNASSSNFSKLNNLPLYEKKSPSEKSRDKNATTEFVLQAEECLTDLEEKVPTTTYPVKTYEPDLPAMAEELSTIDVWMKQRKFYPNTLKNHVIAYAVGRKYLNTNQGASLGSEPYSGDLIKNVIQLIMCGVFKLQLKTNPDPMWRDLDKNNSYPSIFLDASSWGAGQWVKTSDPYELENKIEQCTKLTCGKWLLKSELSSLSVLNSISTLKNLEKVHIANAIEISSEVFKLPQLTELTVKNSYNAVSSITDYFTLCTGLIKFNLHDNNLDYIPDSIYYLTQLKSFSLQNSALTNQNRLSVISHLISRLFNLSKLDFSHNKINCLPITISALYKLKELRLSCNRITTLPIHNCTKIRLLDLGYNNLSEIPDSVFLLKNLDYLNLSNNKLSWIPSKITKLAKLESLDLNRNDIKKLPKNMIYMTHLENMTLTEEPQEGLLSLFFSKEKPKPGRSLLGVTYSMQEWYTKHPSLFSES